MNLPAVRQMNACQDEPRREFPLTASVWTRGQMLHIIYYAVFAGMLLMLLSGCRSAGDISTTSSDGGGGLDNFVLPTSGPTSEPSPISTRVMPLEVLTPPPTPSITPIPAETLGLVVEVFDGNTIAVVMDGDPGSRAYQVKYLGIDSPSAASGWSVVAQEANTKLTELKIVRLVRDTTEFDDDGYLLRHVYVDNTPVSVSLLEQGLATAAISAPDNRFESEILAAEARARAANTGIWGASLPTPTVGITRPAAPTQAANTPTRTIPRTTTPITVTVTVTATGTASPVPEFTATVTPTASITSTTEITSSEELQGP